MSATTPADVTDLENLLIASRPAVAFFISQNEAKLMRGECSPAYRHLVDQEIQQIHDVLLRIDEIIEARNPA